MNALTNTAGIRHLQGFAVYVLANDSVELAVVPELGAKIISLKNLRTGREWLWHPRDRLELFRNGPLENFSASPLVGMDECLPTILPCAWRNRQLPDHGEVWNQPWHVDENAWQGGLLATSIRLKTSPFAFKRTIELAGNEVRFDYELSNLAEAAEPFIWAIHPLLRLLEGDELELPDSTRQLLNGNSWIHSIASAIPENKCAKVFARPIRESWAAIKNEAQGDRLEFAWNASEIVALGLWLTRGGWHGHHHFAIEPTNADDDSLVIAAERKSCGLIAGKSTVTWQLQIRLGTRFF